MNFFSSVFSEDPDPSGTESESDSPKRNETPEQSNPEDDGGWSFGGLMKTLATRSESVIETYRRDLEEFGTGLKKEIEVAQGSLGTVGHAIDELGNTVLKSTAEIIAQGKEAILAVGDDSDSSDNNSSSNSMSRRDSFSSKPYSRFDAQVRVVQGDVNTYCEEPEDLDDYKKWESEFSLDNKDEEMVTLLEENGDMKGLYKRVVPSMVDHESFWFRYFYKVYKLKQAEDLRANLVKRAISAEDEEELSWDIDDEEENDSEKVTEVTKEVSRLKVEGKDEMGSGEEKESVKHEVASADSVAEVSQKDEVTEMKAKDEVTEVKAKDEVKSADSVTEIASADSEEKKESANEKVPESKPVVDAAPPAADHAPIQESGKPDATPASDKDAKAAPSQDSAKPDGAASSSTEQPTEEDLGWDEIEDMSSIDSKEVSRSSGSPNRAELRKRLSAAEDDEDLSWDIEDDEE